MKIELHHNDLPDDVTFSGSVAIDTETMGLRHGRDRLCLVQLSGGDDVCHLVKIPIDHDPSQAPNLVRLLSDPDLLKIFHFARFDVAALYYHFHVLPMSIYCTKIASKLVRTYTDRHGLKELCRELLGVEISKQEQTSYWGAEKLTDDQLRYAASDVLYLHKIKEILDQRLEVEGRDGIAQASFDYLPYRAVLDLMSGEDFDIFSHA